MTTASQIGAIGSMSTQIAVRLPEHLVEFLDDLVVRGEATSRAGAVTKALMKLQRETLAIRDAEIYRAQGDYPDLEGLAEWSARQPMPWLD